MELSSKGTRRTNWVILILVCLIAACSTEDDNNPNNAIIEQSQFKSDAENWKIVGDAQGGYIEASYSPDGGKTDGYIYGVDDVTGAFWYFSAPEFFLGNQNDYYGAKLEFSLFQQSAFSDQKQRADIIFMNGTQKVCYKIDVFPGEEWTNYSINIKESSGWIKGEYDSGISATEEDIKAVLSNLTGFWIRGEYEHGPDNGGLDDVIFTRQ